MSDEPKQTEPSSPPPSQPPQQPDTTKPGPSFVELERGYPTVKEDRGGRKGG
jgi:hypothetical protein